ncbi:GerMN domain-containing protein [bacterium]|nr:GerMN domain-containing protein [bacterium]
MEQSGKIRVFLGIVLVLIFAGVIVLFWIGHINHKGIISEGEKTDMAIQQTEEVIKKELRLYFGSEDDFWRIETRQAAVSSDHMEDMIRQVVEELLKGPENQENNPIPQGTRIMAIFLDQNGIAYIDLSEEIRTNHPGGTWGELMTIYSIVNTVMDNFDAVKGVKILVMGKEIETLKGHIDTRYPLVFRKQP